MLGAEKPEAINNGTQNILGGRNKYAFVALFFKKDTEK